MLPTQALAPAEQPLLSQQIKDWGKALGFADIGITDTDRSGYENAYFKWIAQNFQGEMDYLAKHGTKRTRPAELEPGTLSIISCRMNYFDGDANNAITQLQSPNQAYISRYALHKDYHKLLRKRLNSLAEKIRQAVQLNHPNLQFRVFTDSAPVMETALAEKAGLGFKGKHSLIIHPKAGSWFFLGEIYLNMALPPDPPFAKSGCGPCTACIQECPTQAIIGDGLVDARRCISYLTIEHKGSIDEALRPLMGNRIYGCDDCQLVCPWNKFAEATTENAFKASQHALDQVSLLDLLAWNATQFQKNFEGSPIRRIGFEQWQRNLCIALGNSEPNQPTLQALSALKTDSALVNEHRLWAIQQLKNNLKTTRPGHFLVKNQPAKAKKYYLPAQVLLRQQDSKANI